MARFDRLVIGGERNLRRDRALTFALGGIEPREQRVGVGNLEIPFRQLSFVFWVYVAVAAARQVAAGVGEAQVVHIVDILAVNGPPFMPIGDLARPHLTVKATAEDPRL